MDNPEKIYLDRLDWLDDYTRDKLYRLGVEDAGTFYSYLRDMPAEMMGHLGINRGNYTEFIGELEKILPENFVKVHDNPKKFPRSHTSGFGTPDEFEMRKFLEEEVPFQCGESFVEVSPSVEFEHKLEGETARTSVYQVTLASGRKIFAVSGGIKLPIKEVYNQDLPDAETASKYHIYGIVLDLPDTDMESAETFADIIGLLEKYRVGYFGKTNEAPKSDL